MLTEQIKEQTKTNHQMLEKRLVQKMRVMRYLAEYTSLLAAFYSYFGGLEMQINQQLNVAVLPDHADRRKATLLAGDLLSLGAALPEMAAGNYLPVIKDQWQALGALYVIEGSTLGGQIITGMIEKQLGSIEGLSFFKGYEANTQKMWESFKQALNRVEADDNEAIIDTANETFLKFSEWLAHVY